MTVSRIRVKLPTKFPSSVTAASPLVLGRTGGAYAFSLNASALQVIFDGLYIPQSNALFNQPVSYPVIVTYGHNIPYLDSDAQFGNAYSQYPLGSVSANPILIGKAGSSIGSSTVGQTFKIVFTSAGLAGSPITKTYTAIAGDTTTTIAVGLAAVVNTDPVLHGLGGKPIFMQSVGAGVFNLQYDSAFSATGLTPLTTATTGSTGTITLASETDALDSIIMQLGRNVPGHIAKAGDALYAIDWTGQDSTGTFNTHYGIISVQIITPTAGGTRARMSISTAGNTGPVGRVGIGTGMFLYDATGVLPTSGDLGAGTVNIPSVGKFSIDNIANFRRVSGSSQTILEATGTDNLVLSAAGAGGVGVDVTPTGGTLTSGRGTFTSGVQVPTTGQGVAVTGGATPAITARNYGTAARLPLALDTSALTVVSAAGTLVIPAVAGTLAVSGAALQLIGQALAVNLNSANTDTAVTINLPTGYTRYKVQSVQVVNTGTTADLLNATLGVFTSAAGAGQDIITNVSLAAITSNTLNTPTNVLQLATGQASTTVFNDTSIFVRTGTAEGTAATADVFIFGYLLP